MSIFDIDINAFANTCAVGLMTLVVVVVLIKIGEKAATYSEKIFWLEDIARWIAIVVASIGAILLLLGIIVGILWEIGALVQWLLG